MGYKNNNFYFLQVNKKGSPRVAFFYALKKKKEFLREKHGFDFAYSTGLQYICPEIIVLK